MAGKNQRHYSYRDNDYNGRAIAAAVLGLVSFIMMTALVMLSMRSSDGVGMWAGAVGITAFAVAFIGMAEGLSSFKVDSRSYLLSKIGTLLCGVMTAAWFLIFCAGLAQ